MPRYQVIAECAHVPVTDHSGVTATHLLYKGAFVPDEVDAKRLKFLVDGGFVAEADKNPIAPNASVPQSPTTGLDSVTPEVLSGEPAKDEPSGSDAGKAVEDVVREEASVARATESPREASDGAEREAKAADELAQRRAAAKAKLPQDGSAPDGRASKDVFVEFLAARGYDYGELAKQDKDELRKLAEQQKS